jgi:hypothetical protein
VTGGESCELALALWVMGESGRALDILRSVGHLRNEDGMYWTGYVFEGEKALWPSELTTWTAASLLLAVAALGGDGATTAVFGGEHLPRGTVPGTGCCA